MNIQISGKGKSIVLLHGYCESMNIWKGFEKGLSPNYQVILIDLPGHGQSEWKMEESTVEEAAYDIHKLLGDHGVFEYFLIGHSLGGYISLAITELFPHAVTGIGLLNSTTFADDKNRRQTREKVIKYLQEKGVAEFTRNFVPTLFTPKNRQVFKTDIDQLKDEAAITSLAGATGFAQAMKDRPDRTHVLENFKNPAFVLAGDQDSAVPLETSQLMASKINVGESKILKNCGHMAFIEAKEESLEFVKAFITTYTI